MMWIKVTAVLFLLAGTLPVVMPAAELLMQSEQVTDSCCESRENDSQKKKDDCNGKTCNPFHICGSCTLIFQPYSSVITPVPAPVIKPIFYYAGLVEDPVVSDKWQPPRS